MTKLCPRGKAAAKRKFKVYPSAYANAYASKICAGKIKDPSGVKRKDFRGRKPASMGGSMDDKRDVRKVEQMIGGARSSKREMGREQSTIPPKRFLKATKKTQSGSTNIVRNVPYSEGSLKEAATKFKKENPGFRVTVMNPEDMQKRRKRRAGGGLMEATARLKKQGLKGGGISQRGLGRAFMKGGRV